MTKKILFLVEGENGNITEKTAEAAVGDLVTQAAYRAGVVIQQTCGGTPSCTDCKVTVKEGAANAFEPPEGPELRLLGNVYFITHERLACQAKVRENSTIYVPKPERRQKQLKKKR